MSGPSGRLSISSGAGGVASLPARLALTNPATRRTVTCRGIVTTSRMGNGSAPGGAATPLSGWVPSTVSSDRSDPRDMPVSPSIRCRVLISTSSPAATRWVSRSTGRHPSLAAGTTLTREKLCQFLRATKVKARRSLSLPLLSYSAPGGLRQDPDLAAESSPRPVPAEWGFDVRVSLSKYGGRGGVEPLVGLAVWLGALEAQVRCAGPPGGSGRPTRRREGNERWGRAQQEVRQSVRRR